MENLIRLTYVSKSSYPLSEDEIEQIAVTSQRNNEKKNLTGLLICLGGMFFQTIEGDRLVVEDLFETICEDDRHCQIITIRREENVEERKFIAWSMKTINLNNKLGPLVQQPIRTLFEVVVDQLQHRIFLEKLLLQCIEKNSNKILEVAFEQCMNITEADRGALYQWSEKDSKYKTMRIFDGEEYAEESSNKDLQQYVQEIMQRPTPSYVSYLPIRSGEFTQATFILEKESPFNEKIMKNCDLICLQAGRSFESISGIEKQTKRFRQLDTVSMDYSFPLDIHKLHKIIENLIVSIEENNEEQIKLCGEEIKTISSNLITTPVEEKAAI